jgi:predicted esterase
VLTARTSRRTFLAAGLSAVLTACSRQQREDLVVDAPEGSRDQQARPGHSQGRLAFRPAPPSRSVGRTGQLTLRGTAAAPPAEVYVPPGLTAGRPARLVVVLHGAGGQPRRAMHWLRPHADRENLVLLAPKASQPTWDAILGGFGPDVANIDRLVQQVVADYPIDSHTVLGFSDGASYALSLGIANGDLFDSVIAFSPGFSAAQQRNGRPRFFVSHGTDDPVLPIERTSRQLVPALERAGYDVTYEEFSGEHEVPSSIHETALTWLRTER